MKKVLKTLGIILIVVVLAVAGFVGFLTVKEYNPDTVEKVSVENNKDKPDFAGDTVKILSFNTGYGCLGDNADFFMDGGESVMSTDEERMKANMAEIEKLIAEKGADFNFLQEVDTDSKRTYGVNQVEQYITNSALNGSFALNYSCPYVPYPMPPIGKVNSGILTMGKYNVTEAQRVSLPVPFKWPVSTANLKRCLLVSRAPIAGSDKELVLVNLHLEAYDSGEGKIAQTKMLFNILEEEYKKGNYVIAGGDFNQTFPAETKSILWQAKATGCPAFWKTTCFPRAGSSHTTSTLPLAVSLMRPITPKQLSITQSTASSSLPTLSR